MLTITIIFSPLLALAAFGFDAEALLISYANVCCVAWAWNIFPLKHWLLDNLNNVGIFFRGNISCWEVFVAVGFSLIGKESGRVPKAIRFWLSFLLFRNEQQHLIGCCGPCLHRPSPFILKWHCLMNFVSGDKRDPWAP